MQTIHKIGEKVCLAIVSSSIAALPGAVFASEASVPSKDIAVTFNVQIKNVAAAGALRRTLVGAFRRLGKPRCQQVFSDFSDPSGRSLRRALEELGQSGQSYLGVIIFYDGMDVRRCRFRWNLAVTSPGSRAVHICPNQFTDAARNDPSFVEATLIHELLHSLGLGENPPSSLEITRTVLRRCGG